MHKLAVTVLLFYVVANCSPAYALEIGKTPKTEFADTAPLMLTAYQTAGAATSLAALEFFNAGDQPIAMSDWRIEVATKSGSRQAIVLSTEHKGFLLPKEHITAAVKQQATYELESAKQESPIVAVDISYALPDMAYRPATAVIKDTSDVPFFRTYTTTGYSSAAQPFAATPSRSFYDDGLYEPPVMPAGLTIVEVYPYASDCAPDDASVLCGDYIKLQNNSENVVPLDDLVVRTDSSSSMRTASNTFMLSGNIQPHGIVTVAKTDGGSSISLTNSGGYVWLEDAWGMVRYDGMMTKYEPAGVGQQGFAYALGSGNIWQWTTTPQPLGTNIITAPIIAAKVVTECPEGKYRNPDTGRCRTLEEAVNAISVCDEGYERNPVTNRCRKIQAATTAVLTPCLEGQERNPMTNRCRSIASAVAELLPCEDGQERSPETHRCRKAAQNGIPKAEFPVQPVQQARQDMAGWLALGGVVAVAAGYGAWEWRSEIKNAGKRLFKVFARIK